MLKKFTVHVLNTFKSYLYNVETLVDVNPSILW